MVKAATAERFERSRGASVAGDVGKRIREARLERGMSLAQVGGEDLTRSFLSLVELGRSRISLRALAIVAERLDLPMSYFLDDGTAQNETIVEIALDEAEGALGRQEPSRVMSIINGLEIPARLQSRALWLQGEALRAQNHPRDAVPVLLEGLDQAERRDDVHHMAQIRYSLGAALYSSGNYDEALGHLRRGLDILQGELEDPIVVGKITVCIGHILFMRGDVDGAIQQYMRARDLFDSLQDLNAIGCVYSGLSQAYMRKGDMSTALRYSRLGVGAFAAKQNAQQAAGELNNIAMHYQELGKVDEAIEAAQEALDRARTAGATQIEAAAHATLAAIYLRQERFDQAAVEATAAEEHAGDCDPAHTDASLILASIAERDGRTQEADRRYRDAIDALRDGDLNQRLADVTLAYSLVLRRRGSTEQALEYALQAAQARSVHA